MERERIDIVDNSGRFLGTALRSEAYERGLLHPAVAIAVFDQSLRIYLQLRSGEKATFPGYWDISAAEHLKAGESYISAAIRGLQEELSINLENRSVKLMRGMHVQNNDYQVNGTRLRENELVELYGVIYEGDLKINSEVSETRLYSLDQVKSLLRGEVPFTPWGREELEFIINNPQITRLLRQ